MEYIIVNATALDRSGALTILRQFIGAIPADGRRWLLFVAPGLKLPAPAANVRIEPVAGVKPLHKRVWWDTFGLKRWLKKNDVEPVAAISLQNTGFRVGKRVPSFIYYHQSIPFFRYRWNPFKSEQRTLWFYKRIYPVFVRLFLRRETYIFVQLDYIKQGFARFFGHPEERIGIFSPSVLAPTASGSNKRTDPAAVNLFYPAAGYFYKNHKTVETAVEQQAERVKAHFTLPKPAAAEERKPGVEYLGGITFNEVCDYYYECDALVFPSCIETFGLPLLEAAMTGMPIIAADLPYAREVLDGYEGAVFVRHDDPAAWAEAIGKLEKGKRYEPIDISGRPSWKELFATITREIENAAKSKK